MMQTDLFYAIAVASVVLALIQTVRQRTSFRLLLLLTLGLAACSPPGSAPSISTVMAGRAVGIKGYGVEPVAGDSLGVMLARCSDSADKSEALNAECDQLHRTVHSQPGNSVSDGH